MSLPFRNEMVRNTVQMLNLLNDLWRMMSPGQVRKNIYYVERVTYYFLRVSFQSCYRKQARSVKCKPKTDCL